MRIFVAALIALCCVTAFAAMTTTSPKKSPMLNSYGQATVTDEHGTKLPIIGVVLPDSNGHTGLATSDLMQGGYSQVTGLQDPPQFKLSNGKTIPLWSLSTVDPSTKLPVPLQIPAANASYSPAAPSAWASPAPATVANAIDRLAAWVEAQPSASPIP